MPLKYTINLNEGNTNPPQWVEIKPEEAKPKSRTAHADLMKKYGATKKQRNDYRKSVDLQEEP